MKSFKDSALLFLKGIGMGSADVVPGVSGGTIAFITGIYEDLLASISSVDKQAIQYLLKLEIKNFWEHINGGFLLPLFLGIFLSILSLAKVISFSLDNFPIPVWSFFFGLIIISSISVTKEIKKWNAGVVLSIIVGVALAYGLTTFAPVKTPDANWFIFLSGALAICAMILPGISGSFILLILGKYTYIINAVKDMDLVTIAIFGSGCVVGILSFSRLVSWFLKKFHDYAIALLAGFMIGALNKIWPWKKGVLFQLNRHGEQVPVYEENLLPNQYLTETGNEPQIIQAILFMAFGFMLVVLMEKLALFIKAKKAS